MQDIRLEIASGRIAGWRLLRQAGNEQNAAPPVLALHGWLDNAASFVPLAAHLDGIDLVAIDLPGHGVSAHLAPGADYSFASTVNALLDVADALQWQRFAVLGHSMGAGIGSLLAAACPDRVERFVAIEPWARCLKRRSARSRACAMPCLPRAPCTASACACFPTSTPPYVRACRPMR